MIENSKLFKRLKKLEKKEFGKNNYPISTNIKEKLIPFVEDILSRITQYLPEYTLHDIRHCYRVLENIDLIIPPHFKKKLNIVELKILIYAVFLHDIGMVSDKTEEKKIKNIDKDENSEFEKEKKEYENFLKENSKKDDENNKKNKIEDDELYSEYIRKYHVKRSLNFIDKKINTKCHIDFKYKDINLVDYIKVVIESHGLDFEDLKNEVKFPLDEIVVDKKANILYLSTLLRLGDLLDVDVSRTPRYLFEFFEFSNNKSIESWRKSLSLVGKDLTFYNVKLNYKTDTPEIERGIRRYISFLESQIEKTLKLLKYSSYKLELSPKVEITVRNSGEYISANREITLDFKKVINILMGTELYESEELFLRELIQNSRDACKMMECYSKKDNREYKPKIEIKYDSENKILSVYDNGIGMNDYIVDKYLITIGQSSYQKDNFKEDCKDFYPVSNFGIGVLSCFMVSESINVQSIRYKEGQQFDKPIDITLKLNDKYIVDNYPEKPIHQGTKITLKLKDDFAKKLEDKSIYEILENNILVFEIPIKIEQNNKTEEFNKKEIEIPQFSEDEEIIKIGDKKEDICEGVFIFFQEERYYEDIVSQYGFIINSNDRKNILPYFKFKYYSININKKEKFNLQASRNKIIKDEEFKKIVDDITISILKRVEEELNQLSDKSDKLKLLLKYFNNFLNINHKIDSYITKFFHKNILLEKVEKEENSLITLAEMKDKNFKEIIVIDERFFKYNIIDKNFSEIYEADLTLSSKYFSNSFKYLIDEKIFIISETKGVVYEKYILSFDKPKQQEPFYYLM